MYQFMTSSVSEHYLHSDPASPSDAVPSEAVRIRRANQRAAYDRATIDAILDDGLVAHVGTIRDGKPVVIPMFYVRDGDALLIHGAPASGAIRRARGTEVCVTVTTRRSPLLQEEEQEEEQEECHLLLTTPGSHGAHNAGTISFCWDNKSQNLLTRV